MNILTPKKKEALRDLIMKMYEATQDYAYSVGASREERSRLMKIQQKAAVKLDAFIDNIKESK